MYSKVNSHPFGGVRGTHHAPGLDHVYYVNNNGNTGLSVGQVLRLRVTPLERVSEGSRLVTSSPATQINLDAGPWDVQWTTAPATPFLSGSNASAPKLARSGSVTLYKYSAAPSGGLQGIDPASLPLLAYSGNAILESGQNDVYYAAKLSSANYSVFRVYKDPVDATKTRFDWISYKLNSNADIVGFGYDDPRDIVLSEDLSVAYVTAKDENGLDRLLAVPNTSANHLIPAYNAYGISSSFAIDTHDPTQGLELNNVQQIALHGGNVYVVDAQWLWCIDPTGTSPQTPIAALPNGGVGLLIDTTGIAIITDTLGNILQVDITAASPVATQLPPPTSSLPGPTGFLAWTDDSKTAFFAGVLDPDNKMYVVDRANPAISLMLDLSTLAPPLADPWSVEVLSPSRLFIACNNELGTLSLAIASNALVLGIGLVPFDYIIQAPASPDRGRADTTQATGYFYQVNNAVRWQLEPPDQPRQGILAQPAPLPDHAQASRHGRYPCDRRSFHRSPVDAGRGCAEVLSTSRIVERSNPSGTHAPQVFPGTQADRALVQSVPRHHPAHKARGQRAQRDHLRVLQR
jgi:hypothetical protein